jgi:hypothetical protein
VVGVHGDLIRRRDAEAHVRRDALASEHHTQVRAESERHPERGREAREQQHRGCDPSGDAAQIDDPNRAECGEVDQQRQRVAHVVMGSQADRDPCDEQSRQQLGPQVLTL